MSLLRRLQQLFGFESRLDRRRRLARRAPLLLESLEDRNLLSAGMYVYMSLNTPSYACVAGDPVSYTVTVENIGADTATGVELAELLPSGETYLSQTETWGPAATLGHTSSGIDDLVPPLASFSSATFSVTALVSSAVPYGTTLTETMTATAANAPSSASASISATINTSISLGVSAAAPPVVADGGEIVYRVRVTNSGPSDAPSVDLNDVLPTGVTYSSQVQTGGPAFSLGHSGSTIDDTISGLAAGASATFDFVGTVGSGVANNTTLSDTATASYSIGSSSVSTSTTVTSKAYTDGPVSVTNPGAQTGVEGSGPSLSVSATDYVSGATLSYSAEGLPPGLHINYSTGVISGSVAAGDAAGGPYNVTVTAGDGTYTADVTFAWTVASPVSITSPGAQSGVEGSGVSLSISASDSIGGSTLSFTGYGLPAGLMVNPSTGAVTGTLAVGDAAAGPYEVTLTANDGTYSSGVTFPWAVTAPLTLAPIADRTSTEGASVSLTVSHSYSGGGTLAYTAEGLPPGLSISTSTGAISGTVAAGDADLGPYYVTVAAGDGTSGASRSFTWYVNSPITITTPAVQTSTEGDGVSLSISASDSSMGTLTYGAVGLPAGLSINYSTGAISGTVSSGDAAGGPYAVTLLAEDGTYRNTTEFTWDVSSPVTLTPPADQTSTEGGSVSLGVSASYSGGGLTYSATGLPNGLSINSSTGVISGTAGAGGSWEPTVTASSGSASASVTFSWDVSGPITIADPGPQRYNAGDAVSLPITAGDTAAGTLSYSAASLPSGLSINSSTGLISGTISSSLAVGVYTGTVTATDGTNTSVDSFPWTISAAGAVVVTDPGTETNTEGDGVSLTVGKSYSGSGTLAYAAEGLPPGLKINPSTGAITGTVAAGDSVFGPYDVTATVTDGTATDSQYFVWNVSSPISLTNPGTQSSTEGGSVSLSISASYSGGSLTYSADGLPAGLKINPSTGAITGTLAAGAAAGGPYFVTLQAAHGSYAAEQTFTWDVSSPITLTRPADQTTNEGSSVSLSLSASDSVGGSTLKYSALGLPPGLKINASTGAITGTAAVGDAGGGAYSVDVIAEDGTYSALQSFNWTISSPVTITTPADQTGTEGGSVSLSISASESGATLYYAAEGLPPGLVINPTTGVIGGTVAAGDAAGGPYFVTVNANDGTYSASADFTWNINSPVSITVPNDQTNNQGVSVTLGISVSNTAGGTLSYSATGLPSGLSISSSTGVISGTVGYGGWWEPTVTVTNGTYSDTESFGWTVNSFASIMDPGDQLNQVDDAVSLTVAAADLASGTLSYSASGLPTGLSINSSTGAITGTVGSGASTSTPYTTTITASDGTNAASDTFTWTINPSGPVSIPYVASQTSTAGDEVALPLSVNNTAGKTLLFAAAGLPAGLYINPVTGLIFGTVSASAVSGTAHSVTVTAGAGSSSASQTFNWTVNAAGTVTLANPGDQFTSEGSTVSVSLSGTDSSSGTLYFAAFGLPDGLKINPSTGAVTGTLAAGDAADGPYVVTVIANDGTYSASQTFAWNVSAPITITQPADQTNSEGNSVSLSITASDSGGTLSYAAEGLPPGLKIDPSSGAITGTVAVQDAAGGPYFVTVIAVDGTYSNGTTFTWNVNSPITITVPDTQSNNDGDSVSLAVSASDTAGGTLTYSAQDLPPGLAIDPSTGAITGTVALGDSTMGTFEPTLVVTDGTYTGYASFEWDVSGAISITDPGGQANVVGDAVTLPLAAYDSAGGATLTFAATGLPAGLSINTATGEITGTISSTAASVGDYTTTVTVSDGTNTSDDTFDWSVVAAGTVTLATPGNQTTTEGSSGSLSLSGSGGTLHYFAEGLPPGLKINPSTGTITGTMAAGDSAYGPYTVTVIATDGTNSAEETFTWGAGGVVTITPVANQTSTEGDTVSLSVSASDSVSGATLKYSAVGLPALSINTGTGAITGTVALDAAAAGPYRVVVTAADGAYSASLSFTWTVNGPLTLMPVADEGNYEGDAVTLTVGHTYSGGGALKFTETGLPAGLNINPSTGAIGGAIAVGGMSAFGPYSVTVTANDGAYSASTKFNWNVNDPITITDSPAQEDTEGSSASWQIEATDAAGGTLHYFATNLPPGLSINPSTGLISGTISDTIAALGSFEYTLRVTDGTYTEILDPTAFVVGKGQAAFTSVLTLTRALFAYDPPPVPKNPPEKFSDGDPDANAAVGTSWLTRKLPDSGDMFWITRDPTCLDGYIFIKDTGAVIPCGSCKWLDGFNFDVVVNDEKGRIAAVYFFNIEPVNVDDKPTLKKAFLDCMKPVNKLIDNFPDKGTAADKENARKDIAAARTKAVSSIEDYVQANATGFVRSTGKGTGSDVIPDKGFYNALEYKWTRADNAAVVYRLQAPVAAGGKATWTEYKRVKLNGEVTP